MQRFLSILFLLFFLISCSNPQNSGRAMLAKGGTKPSGGNEGVTGYILTPEHLVLRATDRGVSLFAAAGTIGAGLLDTVRLRVKLISTRQSEIDKAKDSPSTIIDLAGTFLGEGLVNEDGSFSFDANLNPTSEDILVVGISDGTVAYAGNRIMILSYKHLATAAFAVLEEDGQVSDEGFAALKKTAVDENGGGFTGLAISEIYVSDGRSCAIAEGKPYCWGDNAYQKTTFADASPVISSPTLIPGFNNVTKMSLGGGLTCVIDSNKAYCWGKSENGALGNNNGAPGTQVTGIPDSVTDITALDSGGACAISAGAAYCWGNNSHGEMGIGSADFLAHPVPEPVFGLGSGATEIGGGAIYACAIHNDEVKCWGFNFDGQLGTGASTSDKYLPQTITSSGSITPSNLSVGYNSSCIIHQDGTPRCWGPVDWQNTDGRDWINLWSPGFISALPTGLATTTSTSASHNCAIRNGALYCWGNNSSGLLGPNTPVHRDGYQAVQVPEFSSGVDRVAVSNTHTCILHNGAMKCWGGNTFNQIDSTATIRYNDAMSISIE